MAINTWRIMATPQVCRRSDIASPSIQQAGRRPDIKTAEFFNTTGAAFEVFVSASDF
jgi:hypothetical protein